MDHAADEVHEEPQEPVMDHVGPDTKRFPDGPHDTSVLTLYADHMNPFLFFQYLCLTSLSPPQNQYHTQQNEHDAKRHHHG